MINNISIFAFNEEDTIAKSLAQKLNTKTSYVEIHTFPDKENCVRIKSNDVTENCIVVTSLFNPDSISLALLFLSETLRDYGAKNIILVAPYLAYMRQDKRFNDGEGVTAKYYARLISQYFDRLITVDPHLHRILDLNEVYSIPSHVIHAAPVVADWIKDNIKKALLIGPDSESEQWVKDLAQRAGVPFVVLEKVRRGDQDVEVSMPHVDKWSNHTPVLFDDIISTGKTMIETINHLKQTSMSAPICIGVHGVFVNKAYQEILDNGADRVITTNSIRHPSNKIDLTQIIYNELEKIN
jgi:ribose-phosphate pyrophosphokinase